MVATAAGLSIFFLGACSESAQDQDRSSEQKSKKKKRERKRKRTEGEKSKRKEHDAIAAGAPPPSSVPPTQAVPLGMVSVPGGTFEVVDQAT